MLVVCCMPEEQFFGAALRQLRNEKNLTQEQLAARSDVDRVSIGVWENGEKLPRIDSFFKLAKGLDVPPQEFISLIIEISSNKD